MINYAKIVFDEHTESNLFDFCMKNSLGIANSGNRDSLKPSDFKFHLTVIYSRATHPDFEEKEIMVENQSLHTDRLGWFGPDENIVGIIVKKNEWLSSLHERYKKAYGHVSDFGEFKPHVSIKGTPEQGLSKIDLPNIGNMELRMKKLIQVRKNKFKE